MRINKNRWIVFLLFGADIISIALIFNLVTYVRGLASEPIFWPLIAPGLVFVLALHLIDGYGARTDMLSLDYASLHLIASLFAALTTLLLTFAFIPAGFELQSSRAAVVISFGLLGPLALAYRRLIYGRFAVSRGERHLVFIGAKDDFDIFSAECARMGMQMPLLHSNPDNSHVSCDSVLESIATSKLLVEAIVVKESGRDLPPDAPMKLVQLAFAGTPTYTLELFHEIYWRKIPLYRINPIWLFQEGFPIAREPVFERIKRFSDILLSIFGLLLSAPVVCLAAMAIKIDDGGRVFFPQVRIGRHKKPFKLIKLRTMREGGGKGDPYTQLGDARITRVGKLLRAARLDELHNFGMFYAAR